MIAWWWLIPAAMVACVLGFTVGVVLAATGNAARNRDQMFEENDH